LHLDKSQAKGAGSSGMTNLQDELVGENDVLSNRDKVQDLAMVDKTANGSRPSS
jgi:hypothetical protein